MANSLQGRNKELKQFLSAAFEKHKTFDVLHMLFELTDIDTVVVAGGSIRNFYENNTDVSDIDLYLLDTDMNKMDIISKAVKVGYANIEQIYRQCQVIKINGTQIISIQYYPDFSDKDISDGAILCDKKPNTNTFIPVSTPDEIIAGFDLTCCQGAVLITRGTNYYNISDVIMSSKFLPDICRRDFELVNSSVMYIPPMNLKRFYKYVSSYGYKIQDNFTISRMQDAINNYVLSGGCFGADYNTI